MDSMPIFSLATPRLESALCVFRLSGQGCLDILAGHFSRPDALSRAESAQALHGWILDGETRIDEVVALIWRAPHGYTGEDGADIMAHGSLGVIRRLSRLLSDAGMRQALPGEFSFRAYANGKMDLSRAEAVADIISSPTELGRELASRRLAGALADKIQELRGRVLESLAMVEVQLDYSGEDDVPDMGFGREALEECLRELEALRRGARLERLSRNAASLVLAGRVNSGKSSLFNALLREDRAIVSPEPGTTRDYLEASLELGGLPIRLIDTAGLRRVGQGPEAAGGPEAVGIGRSRELYKSADIIAYLVDAQRGLDPEDEGVLSDPELEKKIIRLWSKSDLGPVAPQGFLGISVVEGQGLAGLIQAVEERLLDKDERAWLAGKGLAEGPVTVANDRQVAQVDRAIGALRACLGIAMGESALELRALELGEALEALGEISGEALRAEVLEGIFSRFCVGK